MHARRSFVADWRVNYIVADLNSHVARPHETRDCRGVKRRRKHRRSVETEKSYDIYRAPGVYRDIYGASNANEICVCDY